MAENFVGKMDSLFHPFCSEKCPCLNVCHEKQTFNVDNIELEVESFLTCEHYEVCAKLVPAIRDGRVNINAMDVSNVDTGE